MSERPADESPESRMFRDHMGLEDEREGCAGALREAGYDPAELDFAAFAKVGTLAGVVREDGFADLLLEPKDLGFDNVAFDKAVIGAGIGRYLRPVLPSDRPNRGEITARHVLVVSLSSGAIGRLEAFLPEEGTDG